MFNAVYFMFALTLFAIFCIFYYKYCIILDKYNTFCDFYKDFVVNKTHFYLINNTSLEQEIKFAYLKTNPLFACEDLNDNKEFLLFTAKKIDLYFKKLKVKFRGFNNQTLVEVLSSTILVKDNFINFQIYKTYKHFLHNNIIQKKEIKVLKFIFIRDILKNIINLKQEFDDLLKIINKSKNANCIHNYKNNIYYYCQIYSFCKFGNNLKLIQMFKHWEINYMISRFISYLYKQKHLLKIYLTYLHVLMD